ncbi:hypothetical protein [Bacillus thuringiensis]|uniref:hypothetical protein n=1 Tax=Bacillus thuringiensis TaxID=1428 RepID=UPI000BF559BF|nr:hypothetical protein [Bacillus thuringiensis]PFN89244.1 hypothetical protein COJ76_09835 [Bacillus thuringiensis]PGO19409.1 hypothetical protein CN974_11365 [Bacillus thuringiensis]
MDFKVYQIYQHINYEGRERELRDYLIQTGFFDAGHGLTYLINNDVEFDEGVITGTISEEFIPNSFGVNDDKSIRFMDEYEPFERTFFAYDFETRAFLVQNRRYSPTNLNPGRTFTRLEEIFTDAFNTVFESGFTPVPVLLPEGNELFIRLFTVHRVVELKVKQMAGRGFIGEVSEDETENEIIQRIWNEDDSHMDMIHLKTTAEGDLNDNVLAFAAMNAPNVVIDKIKYYDPEEDGFVTKNRSSMDKFPINNIDKDTESITAFQVIINTIHENRGILRRMRQIRNDE